MTSTHAAKTFVSSLIFTGLLLIATCLLFIVGPVLESKYLPVITDMDMTETVAPEGDMIALLVSGRKTRACKYLETNVLVMRDGKWEKGATTFKNVKLPSTRPTGQQSFGEWRVKPEGQAIKFEIRYECHPLWDTVTELPIWERQ